MTPADFIADFFKYSTGAIYLCSLPNERNGGRPAEICGRGDGTRLNTLVLQTWDRTDRGTFFCVSALTPGQARRSKETVCEITCLHADLDFSKIGMTPDAVLRQLQTLEYPPSKIVSSGHGLHCYWLLTEALTATPEIVVQAEIALRGIADMLAGDPAVAEVARLMRLPGSHNTKNGERLPVKVVSDTGARYELDDLCQWIKATRVLIPRKGAPRAADNPFLSVNIPAGGPAIDVDARLAAMTYQGAGDAAVHATQVSVTAAMLSRGTPIDEVVRAVLGATRAAAGAAGSRWNWVAEEKTIRGMCDSWTRKKLNGQHAPKHGGRTVDDLLTLDFKPMEHFIPDLIPAEGVTLLVSKPKVGKSWLLYDICISATLGRELLGGRKAKQGHCLYLALEDSWRRLRSRAEKLLAYHLGPCPGVTAFTTWDRVDNGGLELIEGWVMNTRAQGHAAVCVCIDVLQMIRPLGGERQSVYQRDYVAMQGLRKLAAELGIAVIVAHHQRKGSADDLQDTISGTQGLPAAADCSIVLERQASGGFILDVRGRDVEAQQLSATFDKDICRWSIGGDANELRRSETRRLILEALRGAPDGMTPREIGDDTGLKAGTVRPTLLRMVRDGDIKKTGGKYRAATVTLQRCNAMRPMGTQSLVTVRVSGWVGRYRALHVTHLACVTPHAAARAQTPLLALKLCSLRSRARSCF
jgi:AAA domain